MSRLKARLEKLESTAVKQQAQDGEEPWRLLLPSNGRDDIPPGVWLDVMDGQVANELELQVVTAQENNYLT